MPARSPKILLLSQVLRFGSPQLFALLSTKRRDGSRLPWVQQVVADMVVMFQNCGGKFDYLGHPAEYPEAWSNFSKCFPGQWAHIVFVDFTMSMPSDAAQSIENNFLVW